MHSFFSSLPSLPSLRHFNISHISLHERGFDFLSALPSLIAKLESLDLSRSDLTLPQYFSLSSSFQRLDLSLMQIDSAKLHCEPFVLSFF
jgi:hypothetical protein